MHLILEVWQYLWPVVGQPMVMDLHNLASWPQHPKLLLLPSAHPTTQDHPENKVHGANMGPIWGREDPCGPHELCYLGNNYHRRKELVQMACWATSLWQCFCCWVEPNPGPLNDKRPVGLYSFTADSNCGKWLKTLGKHNEFTRYDNSV